MKGTATGIALKTFGVFAGALAIGTASSPFGVPMLALLVEPDLYPSMPNPFATPEGFDWLGGIGAYAADPALRSLLAAWCLAVLACMGLMLLLRTVQRPSRDVENGILGSARVVSDPRELKLRNDFWDGKGTPEKAGLVLGSSKRGYFFDSAVPHAAILGRTGSGKTFLVCIQTLHLLFAKGWSCFITGKNEMYELTSDKAKELGYRVMFFNLSGAYPGACRFNPLQLIAEYAEKREIDRAQRCARQTALDILPKTEGDKNSFFSDAARSCLCACMLIVAFAPIDPSEKSMASVCSLINLGTTGDGTDPSAPLKSYIRSEAVGPTHPAFAAATDFLSDGGMTTAGKNVLSTLKEALSIFNDEGIRRMTAKSDISIRDIVRGKTAVYMSLLEENDPYLVLPAIFFSQYWRIAQEEAEANGGKLPRETAIVGDEWGNLPRISCLPEIATLGRSMRIHAFCFTQDLKQWNKYSDPNTQNSGRDKILGCMGIKMALSLANPDDCEWFAKICGKRTVRTQGVSSQRRGAGAASGSSESYTERADDLIHPWELPLRNPIRDGIIVAKAAENSAPGREGVFQFEVDYASNTPAGEFFGIGAPKQCDAKRAAFYQRQLEEHAGEFDEPIPCWVPDFPSEESGSNVIEADEWSAWDGRKL